MKTNAMKKALLVLVACGACVLTGCRTTEEKEAEITRVLMIGNSFSISCMRYLPLVAKDRGVKLDLTSLYIGGCSLQQHCQNADKELKTPPCYPYRLGRVLDGESEEPYQAGVVETLQMAQWDIVTIQQASHESWKADSYQPYGDDLVALIRRYAPQAKIVVQETWSYTPWDKRLAEWKLDQNSMYDKLKSAYAAFAEKYGFERIRMGTAVQEWRRRLPVAYTENSFGGDVVGGGGQADDDCFRRKLDGPGWEPNCDVFHLNRRGEYLQALVWAAKLLDVELGDETYRPDCVSETDAKLMREIAAELAK